MTTHDGLREPQPLEALIRSNLDAVRRRLAQAARAAGRDPAEIRLLAVSKTFDPEHIRAAAAAGQRDFGENRVQEALTKLEPLADLDLRWHLIGHLQSNKVRKAVVWPTCIHSIDSVALLQRLDAAALDAGSTLEGLVQVDLAGEATKHGASVGDVPRILECGASCQAIRLRGLMLLPPLDEPEAARPYFRQLRELRDRLRAEGHAASMLEELSMGMSHDFEVAIAEGATIVRVGSALFGARPTPSPARE